MVKDAPGAGGKPMSAASSAPYLVVARRYRPQGFHDLVGQQTVAQALQNAIRTGRVGHAYLFTGARGVGKTSTARILAKALNCVEGPTAQPCHRCDICQGIATGEDVDVLEIDGASNRGIDEVRQLRSTIAVRPSRARFKIYIIDEVHMLTKEAFNALLKTLEEPPSHVKFIFCTTDPGKIPITVVSRCQRFDFQSIDRQQIIERLGAIAAAEGVSIEREAVELIARRAAGSLRDSQSLLEQVLALSGNQVTAEHVHQVLGTAPSGQVAAIIQAWVNRDPAAALRAIDQSLAEGVDAAPLATQLNAYLRDLLVLAVGGDPSLLMAISTADFQAARQLAASWGADTLLAALEVVDHALGQMRNSLEPRVLLEVAAVQIARMEDLESLAAVIDWVRQASGRAEKKNLTPRHAAPRRL